jgi:hypothetical protein
MIRCSWQRSLDDAAGEEATALEVAENKLASYSVDSDSDAKTNVAQSWSVDMKWMLLTEKFWVMLQLKRQQKILTPRVQLRRKISCTLEGEF